MSFKRQLLPSRFNSGPDLDNDLNAIGINIACEKPSIDPNIEDTLLGASIEGVLKNDGRLLALLIDWISVHSSRINAARLTDVVQLLKDPKFMFVVIFWSAIAQMLSTDNRFKRLAALYSGSRIDFVDRNAKPGEYKSTEFLVQKNGEDDRFKKTHIRIPNKVYPTRLNQISPAESLAKSHMGFRFRVMLGPSYRADIWAMLRRSPHLSPSELAKGTYSSYATAFETKQDYEIVKREYSARKSA